MPKYSRGSGYPFKRGKSWWIAYYCEGEKIREPAKFKDGTRANTEAEARRALRIRVGEIASGDFHGPRVERTTFDELVDALIRDYEINERRSLKQVKIRIDKHLRKSFAGRRAHQITTADISDFVEKRLSEKASNAEINREIAVLKRMFNIALQEGKIARKPYFKAKLPENNVRKGFFEHAEFLALLPRLPEYLHAPVTFAYWFGWRMQSEILKLTWSQVDLSEGSVRLFPHTTKNNEGRVVFLESDQIRLFQWQFAEHQATYPDCELVFHRKGQPIRDFRVVWDRACREAKLFGRIPHDFRRTAVRNMVRDGIGDSVAMKITGHKTRDVFGRYDIVSDGDLRGAATKVSQRIQREMGTNLGTSANSAESGSSLNS